MLEGTVEVELHTAHDLKGVEALDGGSNPVWNQSFLFKIPDGVLELSIQIFYLERHRRDEAIGTAILPLAQVYALTKCNCQMGIFMERSTMEPWICTSSKPMACFRQMSLMAVASGSEFVFTIDSEVREIIITLYDRDTLTANDPLGTAIRICSTSRVQGIR